MAATGPASLERHLRTQLPRIPLNLQPPRKVQDRGGRPGSPSSPDFCSACLWGLWVCGDAMGHQPELTIELGLTSEITAGLPADRDALGLLLAELRQATGDVALAIDCVESLTPSSPTAVSLAELYASPGRWMEIVDLTNDLENDDDLLAYLLIQRGVAFRELRMFDAARESFKRALAPRSRPAVLRHLALVGRGQCYLAEGKRAIGPQGFPEGLGRKCELSRPSRSSRCGRRMNSAPFPVSLITSDTTIKAQLEPARLVEGIRQAD